MAAERFRAWLAQGLVRRIAGGSEGRVPPAQARDGYGDLVCPRCQEAVRPWQALVALPDRKIAHRHCAERAEPEAKPAA